MLVTVIYTDANIMK